MTQTIKSRLKAAAIHFTCSLIIVTIFVLILIKLWYPTPFFSASGGWQGLKIIALVDLILGPLLTLIIFNDNKSRKELSIDLSLIVAVQLAALVWGIHTIYHQRPVAAVFWEDKFYTVPASAIENQNIHLDALKRFSDSSPAYIFAHRPETTEEWQPVLDKMEKSQIPPHHQIELFRPLAENFDKIYPYNLNIKEIIAENTEINNNIQDILNTSNTQLDENHYIGMESKYRNIILIYNANNKLIGSVSAPYKDQ